jgi:hypothetical protein
MKFRMTEKPLDCVATAWPVGKIDIKIFPTIWPCDKHSKEFEHELIKLARKK